MYVADSNPALCPDHLCLKSMLMWAVAELPFLLCRMRSRFDPRGIKKALAERNKEAQTAAATFSGEIEAGALDPESDTFNQGSNRYRVFLGESLDFIYVLLHHLQNLLCVQVSQATISCNL